MSSVSPVNSSSSNNIGQTLSALNLNADSFMKMFTAEIANQDPMQPMDSSSFLTQIAQMTQVESASELSTTLNNLGTTMSASLAAQQFSQAAAFLGQKVQYTDGSGNTQQGTVSAIQIASDGSPSLLVGGTTVSLSSVTEILQ